MQYDSTQADTASFATFGPKSRSLSLRQRHCILIHFSHSYSYHDDDSRFLASHIVICIDRSHSFPRRVVSSRSIRVRLR